jgi:dTDP-4-amino-4,6-dideoxygalactose transaminase
MPETILKVPYLDLPSQYAEFRDEILEAMEKVFKRGDYILGQDVESFERQFAELCGVPHAISVANGTDALILALKVLEIGTGDEVITVPNSFIASASAIALVGARPVFVDVGPDMLIDTTKLERAITPRTRAIIPVHLTGVCAAMDPIIEIAKRRGLFIIEDAAQSVGAKYKGRSSGSFGTLTCFSLHPLKNLNAMGDAGILTTSDTTLDRKLRLLRNHGLKNRDEVSFWGFNSRLDTIQAAILNTRFQHLNSIIGRRRKIAERYRAMLKAVVTCPQETSDDFHTYHVYMIQADRRDALQTYLAARGIDSKIHYPIPLHLQPCAADLRYKKGDFPVCERLAERILSLPVHQYLNDDQVNWVGKSIAAFYQETH